MKDPRQLLVPASDCLKNNGLKWELEHAHSCETLPLALHKLQIPLKETEHGKQKDQSWKPR